MKVAFLIGIFYFLFYSFFMDSKPSYYGNDGFGEIEHQTSEVLVDPPKPPPDGP